MGMGKRKVRINCGDEQDAFTGWRRYVRWGRGEVAKIKRKFRRRERRTAKTEVERSRIDD